MAWIATRIWLPSPTVIWIVLLLFERAPTQWEYVLLLHNCNSEIGTSPSVTIWGHSPPVPVLSRKPQSKVPSKPYQVNEQRSPRWDSLPGMRIGNGDHDRGRFIWQARQG